MSAERAERHVLDSILDYIEGRLPEVDRKRVIEHLDSCPECRTEFQFASSVQESVVDTGQRHLRPERVVEISEQRGDVTSPAEAAHLESCESCRAEVAWSSATPVPTPSPRAGEEERPESGLSWWQRLEEIVQWAWRPPGARWGWAVAVAGAAVMMITQLPKDFDVDVQDLAMLAPLPVRMQRGVPTPGTAEAAHLRALGRYRDGEYQAARSGFRSVLERDEEHYEARLYLGSALALTGELDEAVTALSEVASGAPDPLVREEARWQLANALLAMNRPSDAEAPLRAIVEDGRRRQALAAELLQKLGR